MVIPQRLCSPLALALAFAVLTAAARLASGPVSTLAREAYVLAHDRHHCSWDLFRFLVRLDLQQYAHAFCSRGYTRFEDVIHMSDEQLLRDVALASAAHRNRILYVSADILARRTRTSLAALIGAIVGVEAALCFVMVLLALLLSPEARSRAAVAALTLWAYVKAAQEHSSSAQDVSSPQIAGKHGVGVAGALDGRAHGAGTALPRPASRSNSQRNCMDSPASHRTVSSGNTSARSGRLRTFTPMSVGAAAATGAQEGDGGVVAAAQRQRGTQRVQPCKHGADGNPRPLSGTGRQLSVRPRHSAPPRAAHGNPVTWSTSRSRAPAAQDPNSTGSGVNGVRLDTEALPGSSPGPWCSTDGAALRDVGEGSTPLNTSRSPGTPFSAQEEGCAKARAPQTSPRRRRLGRALWASFRRRS